MLRWLSASVHYWFKTNWCVLEVWLLRHVELVLSYGSTGAISISPSHLSSMQLSIFFTAHNFHISVCNSIIWAPSTSMRWIVMKLLILHPLVSSLLCTIATIMITIICLHWIPTDTSLVVLVGLPCFIILSSLCRWVSGHFQSQTMLPHYLTE